MRFSLQGDGITTSLDSEEETGTGMCKAVLKVFYLSVSLFVVSSGTHVVAPLSAMIDCDIMVQLSICSGQERAGTIKADGKSRIVVLSNTTLNGSK